MFEMPSEYRAEFDCFGEKQWYETLKKFDDANIYQTWAYEDVRHGGKNMSHFILKRNDEVVSIAQARIIKLPIVNIRIAYFYWGPLWRLKNTTPDIEIFKYAIRAIRKEFVGRRGLVVRLRPVLFNIEADLYLSVIENEGYKFIDYDEPKRTIIMDVSFSLEELRKGLDKKWRRHLKIAEKNGLIIEEGYNDDLFGIFIDIYMEMIRNKKFARPNDINEFRKVQGNLPQEFKPRIMICLKNNIPCAGAICCTIGNTAMNVYRATNILGRKNNASYLLQWRIIEWAKERNCSMYNVNGISPEKNPGTYHFKKRLCKEYGKDLFYLGQFQSQRSMLSSYLIKYTEKLYRKLKKIKQIHLYSS